MEWEMKVLSHIIVYKETDEGIQRYKDGKPGGAMGGDGLYKKGTTGYYALRARLNAAVEGVRGHFRGWQYLGTLYRKYVETGDQTYLDRLNKSQPDFVRWVKE